MKSMLLAGAGWLALCGAVWSQTQPATEAPVRTSPQPIYRVTVVSRTLQAVNYEHRSGPTTIGFHGTVLLPEAKGAATVESKRGRVVIDAKFERMYAPSRFGREYLTYVLWAITPEGRPKNLGELVIDPSNKTRITVTTGLQAFGLMVTAEPYYAVTTPSDVVVLENVVRPETTGEVEPITARYELLPRGQYTMNINTGRFPARDVQGEKLPYDRYEAVLEIYQAQNAIQIARSLGADRWAPEPLGKAQDLLTAAQDMQARKQDANMIISRAREAAQMAEDARAISLKRKDEERLTREKQEQVEESRAQARAQEQAEQAQAQAAQEQAAQQADAERAAAQAEQAREQAEQARRAEAQRSRPASIEAQPVPVVPPALTAPQHQSRAELLSRLNSVLPTRDTPRGLLVTLSDSFFQPGQPTLRRPAAERMASLAAVLATHRDLTISVEGFTDDRGSESELRQVSQRRAQEVRATLVGNGVAPGYIQAAGYGRARPIVSNATAEGREQNRRVEIVISGPSIGGLALWDRTYSLTRQR